MNKLYANNTVDGPSSLEELIQIMRDAGMTAAVWMLERFDGLEFQVEDLTEQLSCAEHDLENATNEVSMYESIAADFHELQRERDELVIRVRELEHQARNVEEWIL